MYEIIKISLFRNSQLSIMGKHFMIAALTALICLSPIPSVSANPYMNSDIVDVLSNPLKVPPEVQELATKFANNALPRLLKNNVRLAKQLGFGGSRISSVLLDQALPIMIVHQKEILKFVPLQTNPMDLINNDNNWTRDRAGNLTPKRIIFLLKVNAGNSESDGVSWSSFTLEEALPGSWRVFQVGAPKLAQATKLYETPTASQFILWTPEINRHHLGMIAPPKSGAIHPSVFLTVLSNDPLTNRSAGELFDATSPAFIEKLKKRYKDLELPKRLQGQTGLMHVPSTTP